MEKELINCSKIVVDCAYNDPVDVRAGGPKILGFDFYVKNEETEEMIRFIEETLKETKVPLMSIGVIQQNLFLCKKQIWTKTKIAECILKEADYIIKEAARNYKPSDKIKTK